MRHFTYVVHLGPDGHLGGIGAKTQPSSGRVAEKHGNAFVYRHCRFLRHAREAFWRGDQPVDAERRIQRAEKVQSIFDYGFYLKISINFVYGIHVCILLREILTILV